MQYSIAKFGVVNKITLWYMKKYLLFFLVTSCHSVDKAEVEISFEDKSLDNRIYFVDTLSKNFIIVESSINEKNYYLLVDNGTSKGDKVTIFQSDAYRTGLIDSSKNFFDERRRIAEMRSTFRLNNYADTFTGIYINPHGKLDKTKIPDGILAAGFLNDHFVEIDYTERFIRLHKSEDKEGLIKDFREVDLRYKNGPFHFIEVDFFVKDRKITELVGIDLGMSFDDFFWGPTKVKKYETLLPESTGETGNVSHQGFTATVDEVVFDSINIAGWKLNRVKSFLQKPGPDNVPLALPVLMGNAILKKAGKIFLDLNNNKIYLPHSVYNQ